MKGRTKKIPCSVCDEIFKTDKEREDHFVVHLKQVDEIIEESRIIMMEIMQKLQPLTPSTRNRILETLRVFFGARP